MTSTRSFASLLPVPVFFLLILVHLTYNGGGVMATFSIAATDSETQLVGAAGSSCVANASIYELLYQGVPGHGVLMTQANPPKKGSVIYDIGDELLLNGTDPSVIIETITNPLVDNTSTIVPDLYLATCGETGANGTYQDFHLRQYGCVDLMGRAAGYDDPILKDFYYDYCFIEGDYVNISQIRSFELGYYNYTQEHETGTTDTYTYSAQGNIVVNTTVPALVKNFVDGGGCDMADRLYIAITSVFKAFQAAVEKDDTTLLAGDVRCFSTVLSAAYGMFVHVDYPNGTELIHIDVKGDVDPYPAFVEQYEAWRSEHPCPEGTDGSTGSDTPTEAPSPKGSDGSTGTPGTDAPAKAPSGGGGDGATVAPTSGCGTNLLMPPLVILAVAVSVVLA